MFDFQKGIFCLLIYSKNCQEKRAIKILQNKGIELLYMKSYQADAVPFELPTARNSKFGKVTVLIGLDLDYAIVDQDQTEGNLISPAISVACRKIMRSSRIFSQQEVLMLCQDKIHKLISSIDPKLPRKINSEATRKISQYELNDGDVLKLLSREAKSSKVELIQLNGKSFVKKTFKNYALDKMENEILARELLKDDPRIVPITHVGSNYFLMPYYENTLSHNMYTLPFYPLTVAYQAFEIAELYAEKGYFLGDLNCGSAICTPEGELKFVDFEIMQEIDAVEEYQERVLSLYQHKWFFDIGVGYKSFCNDSPKVIYMKRLVSMLVYKLPWVLLKRSQRSFLLLKRKLFPSYRTSNGCFVFTRLGSLMPRMLMGVL